MKHSRKYLTLIFLVLFSIACGASTPLERLKSNLNKYPEYSIILEDMREDGNFFKDYYHRYKTVYGQKESSSDSLTFQSEIGDWVEIPKKEFDNYANYLGMVVASKSADGKTNNDKYPPGYQYVGNQRYGQWRTDSNGSSFWSWYGKYAMMSTVFGMFNRPVYRNDWNSYSDYRRRGAPYYGDGSYYGSKGSMYGTSGRVTKQTKPNFYQRKVANERARSSKFSNKVKNRVRRSNMSSVRSRSSSRGGK
ncbi:MAG: hypothetical protein DWQ05_09640 [Calditrichaeota bacterium]|nr:MAG: hypothetical protein DWQ05_09640 [Calditrichota bacterium]